MTADFARGDIIKSDCAGRQGQWCLDYDHIEGDKMRSTKCLFSFFSFIAYVMIMTNCNSRSGDSKVLGDFDVGIKGGSFAIRIPQFGTYPWRLALWSSNCNDISETVQVLLRNQSAQKLDLYLGRDKGHAEVQAFSNVEIYSGSLGDLFQMGYSSEQWVTFENNNSDSPVELIMLRTGSGKKFKLTVSVTRLNYGM